MTQGEATSRDASTCNLETFETAIQGLRQLIIGLANVGRASEHMIGLHQILLLDQLASFHKNGCARPDLLAKARDCVELIVRLAERDELPLSHEMDALLSEYASIGTAIVRPAGLPRSRTLARFPKDPPILHSVFVDESGSASFDDSIQPVLCLTSVLVEDAKIDSFEDAVTSLLTRYGVLATIEIHAQECLSEDGPLRALEAADRYELLKEFVVLGMKHSVGIHFMSMLKPLVKPDYRAKLGRQGLDAYQTNVLWFNLTLQVARITRIGMAQYRYVFDRTDKYAKDVRRIISALRHETNRKMKLHAIAGDPVEADSRDHRFLQLADVIGYFLTRYRQFEIRAHTPRESLRKHESKYREINDLVRPHVMSFVEDGLYRLIDWKALQDWRSPKRRAVRGRSR